jgi:hypothetical protein
MFKSPNFVGWGELANPNWLPVLKFMLGFLRHPNLLNDDVNSGLPHGTHHSDRDFSH